ncbi:hypothetical protein ASD11_04410 [Aeromicrobium sp. Root495]|nr:hypothetical protein ASD11_04410 [Aeromicrobium sp. Root495]
MLKVHHPSLSPVGVDEVLAHNAIGNNVGNFAFSYAAERALSAPGNDVTAVATGALFATPEAVNREYDHVVMPLANHFRASNIKALERQAKAMEQFTIPVTVLGVGGQASLEGEVPADEREAVEKATRRFVRAVLERGPSIGVRGDFTKSYLVDLGFDADRVDVIGCPSLYLHGDSVPLELPDAIDPEGPLAINVSPYVTAMGPILLDNLRRYPGLTYFGQDIRTLRLLVEGKSLPGDDTQLPLRPDHPAFAAGRTVFPLSMPVWMSELGQRQMSFGTRIHGNIVSLLAGTPAVVLAHDSRTLELARYHQIPHRQISELSPQEATAEALYDAADFSGFTDGHAARFRHYVEYLEQHGLQHSYGPQGGGEIFDAQVRSLTDDGAYAPVVVATGRVPVPVAAQVARPSGLRSCLGRLVRGLKARLSRSR